MGVSLCWVIRFLWEREGLGLVKMVLCICLHILKNISICSETSRHIRSVFTSRSWYEAFMDVECHIEIFDSRQLGVEVRIG